MNFPKPYRRDDWEKPVSAQTHCTLSQAHVKKRGGVPSQEEWETNTNMFTYVWQGNLRVEFGVHFDFLKVGTIWFDVQTRTLRPHPLTNVFAHRVTSWFNICAVTEYLLHALCPRGENYPLFRGVKWLVWSEVTRQYLLTPLKLICAVVAVVRL